MTAWPALRRSTTRLAVTATLVLLAPFAAASEHGGADALPVDAFEAEVARLASRADALVVEAASRPIGSDELDGLVDAWENVEVHEAIELRATPLYPPIWQTLIGLRIALEGGQEDTAALELRAEAFHGSLLQGLGAVKLVASQVRAGTAAGAMAGHDDHHDDHGAEDPVATVAAIRAGLDRAVEHYRDGDVEGAEAVIHEAYMQRFEALEGGLIALDADLVSTLEADFNAHLPLLLKDGADLGRVRAQVDAMGERLDRVEQLLVEAEDEPAPEIF